MFCCDSRVCTVIKWCSSEADMNICLPDQNAVCISTTRLVTGWSNGVASLDQNIVNEAFELWNVSYFLIKATPRNFHGSIILNNSKLSTDFYATNRLLLLTTRKTEKWMPASTVMGGLCFHKMVYSALVICFKSFLSILDLWHCIQFLKRWFDTESWCRRGAVSCRRAQLPMSSDAEPFPVFEK